MKTLLLINELFYTWAFIFTVLSVSPITNTVVTAAAAAAATTATTAAIAACTFAFNTTISRSFFAADATFTAAVANTTFSTTSRYLFAADATATTFIATINAFDSVVAGDLFWYISH